MRRHGKAFKARRTIGPDGKPDIAIDPIVEHKKYVSGRVDVICHMPSLSLINQCKIENGIL